MKEKKNFVEEKEGSGMFLYTFDFYLFSFIVRRTSFITSALKRVFFVYVFLFSLSSCCSNAITIF